MQGPRFWWQWIIANGLDELAGLGAVAALGYAVVSQLGEPQGAVQSIAMAVLFTVFGAIEGLVVGWAQERVLRPRLPALTGWIRATVYGAVAAWALGMVPSTIMSLQAPQAGAQPPEMSDALQLLLAAALGAVAGPILAAFQWLRLRAAVPRRSAWWLPANAAAWAVGMPVVFAGAQLGSSLESPAVIALVVALTLAGAGAIVGAIHGRVLLWLVPAR